MCIRDRITPPVGFNLFVLQGMTKRDTGWLSKQALPLLLLMVAMVLLMYFVPASATWLPQQM